MVPMAIMVTHADRSDRGGKRSPLITISTPRISVAIANRPNTMRPVGRPLTATFVSAKALAQRKESRAKRTQSVRLRCVGMVFPVERADMLRVPGAGKRFHR